MHSIPVSSRVEESVSKKLDILSKATARSRSFLISEAIKAYVEEQAWQIDAIKEGVKQADQPEMCRPGRVYGTREMAVYDTPFVVPYRVLGTTIEILRVLHGARDWPKPKQPVSVEAMNAAIAEGGSGR